MNPCLCTLLALACVLSAPQGRDTARGGDAQRGGRGQEKPKAAPTPDQLGAEYFRVADYDGDGWIVYAEAQRSLGVDKKSFGVYDKDIDGRIDESEFLTRYRAILAGGGAFPPPVKAPDRRALAKRTPAELLRAFDSDGDDALDAIEITRVLADYGAREPTPEVLLEKLDRDRSKELEGKEIDALLEAVGPTTAVRKPKKAASITELFGKREPRPEGTLGPDLVRGPITPFQRLDYDGDGRVDARDLNALQRPALISIRINAVIATLDTNADGALDEAEFLASMQH